MTQLKGASQNVQNSHGRMLKTPQERVSLDVLTILLERIIHGNVWKVVPLGILSQITLQLSALLTAQPIHSQITLPTCAWKHARLELMVITQPGDAFQCAPQTLRCTEIRLQESVLLIALTITTVMIYRELVVLHVLLTLCTLPMSQPNVAIESVFTLTLERQTYKGVSYPVTGDSIKTSQPIGANNVQSIAPHA